MASANAKTFGEAWDHLTGAPLAHRGLWAPDGAPENSLGAFQHAAENGYGVELDVLLSADGEARMSAEAVAALRALEHVAIAKPHFLALGLDMLPDAKAAEHRVKGLPVVAWTVRSPDQWSAVSEACDNYIFEGFTPPKGL